MLLGFPDGYITGDTTRLAQWTALVNNSLDNAFHIIFEADGRWQFDDRNHTDYPELTANLVSGQRDYPFTTDSNSNLILSIEKVAILTSSTATRYTEISPVDAMSDDNSPFVENNTSLTGIPSEYDKTSNAIFLNLIPNYNATNGIKLYVSREGSYFLTSDATKKPGFAGLYHDYLVFAPAYQYALGNGLPAQEFLKREVLEKERQLTEYYSKRSRDERTVISNEPIAYE